MQTYENGTITISDDIEFSMRNLVRTRGFTQADARIHELERPPYNWKIEH
jgi:hypothetical protein